MAARIIIATIGSLGDLNPFIGIGQALQQRGVSVLMAVPAAQVPLATAAGLDAVPALPVSAGLPTAAIAQRLPQSQLATVRRILIGTLPDYARRLDAVAAGADAIIASPFVLAAPIIAEKHGARLIPAVLQPFALPQPDDPPVSPSLWPLLHRQGRFARLWNQSALNGVRRFLALWLGGAVDDVRAAHGLPRIRAAPLFRLPATPALALYPEWFGSEGPAGLHATGFVRGATGVIDPDLADFLGEGPPPLVFTLGSLAGASPGDFPAAALAASRSLGRRAVLIAPGPPTRHRDVIRRPHVDYAALFPHAAAIVHHGGIGTVAQALAAAKAQLIIPHLGDQFDNAARVTRLRIGHSLPAHRFHGGDAPAALDRLLADSVPGMPRLARSVQGTDGASAAADAISSWLGGPACGAKPAVAALRPHHQGAAPCTTCTR